jgi:hypothetical protein
VETPQVEPVPDADELEPLEPEESTSSSDQRPDGASRDAKGEPVTLEFACQTTQVTQRRSVSAKPGGTNIYARTPGSRPLGNPFGTKVMKRLEDLHIISAFTLAMLGPSKH